MKLTDRDVIAILRDPRPERFVAADFGVRANTVNRIRTGARWSTVAPEIPRSFRTVRAETPGDVVRLRTSRDESTGCINWTGALQSMGYGLFCHKRRFVLAHRAAYEDTHGPIPAGLHVLHRCDNPRCCNVTHLWLGTDQDNKDDCVAKGRHSRGKAHAAAIRAAYLRKATANRTQDTR